MPVVVEVTRSDRLPTRPRIGAPFPMPIGLVPFNSQIAAWPSVFCQRISETTGTAGGPTVAAGAVGAPAAGTVTPSAFDYRLVH